MMLDLAWSKISHLKVIGGIVHSPNHDLNTWDPPPKEKDDDLIRSELARGGLCKGCASSSTILSDMRRRLHADSRASSPDVFLYRDHHGALKMLRFGIDYACSIEDIGLADRVITPRRGQDGSLDVPHLDLRGHDEEPLPYYVEMFFLGSWGLSLEETEIIRAFLKSCMVRTHRHDEVFYLYSEQGSGKGILFDILGKMYGSHLATAPSRKWNERFTTSGFVNKGVVVINDADLAASDWSILTPCTNSDVYLERKGQGGFTGRLDCKFLLISPKLPGYLVSHVGPGRRLNIFKSAASKFGGGVQDMSMKEKAQTYEQVSSFARWVLGGDLRLVGAKRGRMQEWHDEVLGTADDYIDATSLLERASGSRLLLSEFKAGWNESRGHHRGKRVDIHRLQKAVRDAGYSITRENRNRIWIEDCVLIDIGMTFTGDIHGT